MNTAASLQTERPWYREFWVWFVIAFPLAAVIAGISTVVIAVNTSDSLVLDGFQKVGLVARRETALEREALRLNIAVNASFDRVTGQVTVRLGGDSEPDSITLGLFHATRRDLDRTTVLTRDAAGLYRGNIGADIKGHWYVQISDSAGAWRVTDRLADEQQLLAFGNTPGNES